MGIKHARITVNKDPMEKIARTVPLYEIPLLKAIHGGTAVQIIDEVERDVETPSVDAEFERLTRLYRDHPKSGIPVVEHVYGQPHSGGLAKAIESCVTQAEPASRRRRAAEEAA